MPNLHAVLFRRDLRISDHEALSKACAACQQSPSTLLVPLFVYDPQLIRHETSSSAHWLFIDACLAELSSSLEQRGSALCFRVGLLRSSLAELLALAEFLEGVAGEALATGEQSGGFFARAHDATSSLLRGPRATGRCRNVKLLISRQIRIKLRCCSCC